VSASLRKFLASVYTYSDAGSGGLMASRYVKSASSDAHGEWWCSRAVPTGKEVTVGMKADHRIDAVFGFAAQAPVSEHGAIVCDGVQYLIRAVLDRDYGRDEVQVYAERAVESLTLAAS
jgi:hypothetical protein